MNAPAYPPAHNLLVGKVAVITAAAGAGIGQAAARRCLEEGARVVISDAHERRLAETLEALRAEHGNETVDAVPCDVTDEGQVQALFAGAVAATGGLDVVVNNAGLGGTANLVDMTDEQWSIVLDVTLNGTFRCMRAALNHMYANGRGVIVNNASVVGWRAQAEQAHYAAAKAGVMALTRSAAMDLAEHGIRVNAVCPAAIRTAMMAVLPPERQAELASPQAIKRLGEPEEVAEAVVWLLSDKASFVTGTAMQVDAGSLAGI
jgi:3-oxoacyl-[acyl-carrier protein] reductase